MKVDIRLNKNFTTAYNKMQEKYGEEFAQINGFSDAQLSHTDFISNFIDEEVVADVSIDSSSSVKNKDIVSLMNEMSKPQKKLLAFNKIFYEINKKYGFKDANLWLENEWNKSLHMHDAHTSTFLHYCYAHDLKDLAEKGLYFIEDFNYQPPRHLITLVDFVKEFIGYTANRSAGACGLPNLIPYMYYFWREDVKNNYYTETPEKYAKQNIQRFIYAVNQPHVRDQIQSAFTNTSVFDRAYLEALFGGAVFPDGSFMIDDIEGIMKFQLWYLEERNKIFEVNGYTFPVNSISIIKKNGKFADEEFAKTAIKLNMKWNLSNLFVDESVTSLSNCCRLKSEIDLGLDGTEYFNSIGGTALRVGSVKVNTINLARLALENKTEKDYLIALRDKTEICLKALDCQRHIIQRNIEKGLLKNFSLDIVTMDTLYSTIGVLGIYETMRSFEYVSVDEFGNTFYSPKAEAFGKKIFDIIHMTKDQFALDKNYKINLEAIPGETAASLFQKADASLFPENVIDDLPLYGNQFIPLGIKTTLQERIRIAALFDSFCNGGSILHINIDAPFNSFEQAWDMFNYVCDQGVTYFAFNPKIQACKSNHTFYGKTCPMCGGKVITEYTRIVGFFVAIKTFSKARKAEYELREWENINTQNQLLGEKIE